MAELEPSRTQSMRPGMPPLGVGYHSNESRGEWSVPLDSTLKSQLRVPMRRDARAA